MIEIFKKFILAIFSDIKVFISSISIYLQENFLNNIDKKDLVTGLTISAIGGIFVLIKKITIKKVDELSLDDLLRGNSSNIKNYRKQMEEKLQITSTMNENDFSMYKDYILVQYGSSVDSNNLNPNDYDFIVLMLGYSGNDVRYLHNKGTKGYTGSSGGNDVDIVFRDYHSFLFAAASGMPYENSIVKKGKILLGPKGYFLWLKNITKNILFDKEFLLRRFEDKINVEKEEYKKCKFEHDEFEHDKYYVIRSGYYLITSILQKKMIESFESNILTQDDMVELAHVRNYYNIFIDNNINNKYKRLVDTLKRIEVDEDITIREIEDILSNTERINISDVKKNIK